MRAIAPDTPCPCDSGFAYGACCGAADQNSRPPFPISAPISGAAHANLPAALRAAVDTAATRPDLFLARINFQHQRTLWIKMSQQWYDESVFLDVNRGLGTCRLESDLAFLAAIGDQVPWRPTMFIFHTAFCGSTLMSQTLARAYRSLPLREPDALGNLMYLLKSNTEPAASKALWIERVLRILSRRYQADTPVVVKANDYANGLMNHVLQARADAPVLFMYTPLAEFVVGCLKADNRRAWIRDRYSIVKAVGTDILPLPDTPILADDAYAEMAAIYWADNISAYLRAQPRYHTTLRSLAFHHLLAAPNDMIAATAGFFSLTERPGVSLAHVIQTSFGVYSKNAEFRYSPRQRENEMARHSAKFAPEITTAEQVARKLLGSRYPDAPLPGEIAQPPRQVE